MPLHLDLHHEIAQQERERKRDPLKLGMLFLAFVAICCVAYLVVNLNHLRVLRRELSMARTQWGKLEDQEKKAKAREQELAQARALADTLQSNIDTRFFWAPFLELFGQAVPSNVQIARLSANISDDDKLFINLEGIAAGDQPRRVAEEFRLGLEKKFMERFADADASFRSLEESSALVKLDDRELEVVQFAITVQVDTTQSNMGQLPDQRLTTLAENF